MNQNVDYILSPQAVRERSQKLFELTCAGKGEFTFDSTKWDLVTNYVYQTILEKYPKFDIPFHSRLGHFRAGGVDRLKWPELGLEKLSKKEKVQTLIDLIIPSVLLDAGAGNQWTYFESKTGQTLSRSEGLGIASFYIFLEQKLSSTQKLTTDASGLINFSEKDLNDYFQVNDNNPLVGTVGRLHLLQKLGSIITENKNTFTTARPSDLMNLFIDGNQVDAVQVLKTILKYLGPIWPSRLSLNNHALGDTWSHPSLGEPGSFESLVPFHKLSQWLSYSILDACLLGGYQVVNVAELTGLPEYRNGGLFLDLEIIKLKDPRYETCGLTPDMPVTIEWRALTVTLLDELARRLQKKLNLSPEQFPLAKVLEGGSWWAGRRIAAEKRKDASPPVKINSDGTVF
jgi:hypothetical protein